MNQKTTVTANCQKVTSNCSTKKQKPKIETGAIFEV